MPLAAFCLRPALLALLIFMLFPRAAHARMLEPGTRPSGPVPGSAEESRAARLVDVVANGDATWEDREAAEAALAALRPAVVLPLLVPRMTDDPQGPAYPPAAAAADDKDAPPPWQAHHAMNRVFRSQTLRDDAALGAVLVRVLPSATTGEAKLSVIESLATHWSDSAEAPLTKILRDGAAEVAVRAQAAEALLDNQPTRYFREIEGITIGAPAPLKAALWSVLIHHSARGQREPLLLVMGFELMEHDCRTARDDAGGADMALQLEQNLQEHFAPSPADARYHGTDGERFLARDTVAAARRWWAVHGPSISKQAAAARPGPA